VAKAPWQWQWLAPSYLADDCVPVTTVAVDDAFDLLAVDASLSQEPGLHSAHATLRSLVLLCGTVYQRTFRSAPVSLRTFAGKLKTYLFDLL